MAWKYLRGKNFIYRRSTSVRATLRRSLPGEVLISKSKILCGPRHNSNIQCGPPEAHEFDTPALNNLRRLLTDLQGLLIWTVLFV